MRRFARVRQAVSAMSLAEVIVSVGVLAVAILALVAMFTRGMVMLSHSKQVSEATDVAQACLETIKAGGPASISEGVYDGRLDTPRNVTTGFPPVPYPRSSQNYPLVVRASRAGAPLGTMAVSVEVFYENGQKVFLQTYISL